ncbi:hypothetical protein [Streptomyces minutiscleroticus]|uniref:hypothetical protein n=1 Tax=Streptomyces minutiscleroticus TaxID=68238 RepID=UPI003317EC01
MRKRPGTVHVQTHHGTSTMPRSSPPMSACPTWPRICAGVSTRSSPTPEASAGGSRSCR